MKNKVMIMAGGTGGHVIPGLTVADELQAQGVDVFWLGTERGLESTLVPKANIPLHCIRVSGLRGGGQLSLLLAPFKLLLALLQAVRVIQKNKPDLVLGMGGFASGPGAIAAWLLRKPLVIHEQNAIAGLTNKMLSRLSKRVMFAFPNTFETNQQTLLTGNPLRQDLFLIDSPSERYTDRKGALRILVIGGSRGAQVMNEVIPEALSLMNDVEIRHQTGQQQCDDTKKRYQPLNIKADVIPFIDDMREAYAWADLVICRAGALTVSELAAVGLPSILVPYPYAVDDHQTANARFLQLAGAAIVIQQNLLTPQHLATVLKSLQENRATLQTMAKAALSCRQEKATEQVVSQCMEVMHG